ncbi:NAD(P)H-dependent flavin oxidoreductase YrpB (nitropropane dioxygenase family) [Okibacterium sp. HSC-33S16]|uniref:nitronate monooxygenase n=1 Tax=Okibacterium sp. HSC-33S16 TaxID=2910965 RepID=UPI00209F4B95|nr:nitronate monooxygenase [Okibacterium sp. HSC-33S16]MCP2031260.1 NAD(P)H-dependent flavin oxidoreductase YrpB (nitropropane dioxygenase family) [Okibacterium sp. HSC-33S16]
MNIKTREPARRLPAPLDRSKPVWVAPMAGGVSRPELVIAAARAGHFSQLAAGYKSADAMNAEIRQVRDSGADVFGVNLFVPNLHLVDRDDYDTYARSLHATAARFDYAMGFGVPREDDDDWDAKIAALVANPVPVVSFTFGLPDVEVINQLREIGTATMQTVTSVEEARESEAAGVDVLMVQGFAAGGHSGIWKRDALPADTSLVELVREVRATTQLPLAAAGGIDNATAVRATLAAGADAIGVGTLALRSTESGASTLYKNALADPAYIETRLTRAFTGRPARALVNQFVLDHDAMSISGYPAVHHLTRPLRQVAAHIGDATAVHLWAGMGWRSARDDALSEILAELSPGSPSSRSAHAGPSA